MHHTIKENIASPTSDLGTLNTFGMLLGTILLAIGVNSGTEGRIW